jgi:hypothetical protein
MRDASNDLDKLRKTARAQWRLTSKGRKAIDGCHGRFITSCKAAFPRSRFAWCWLCRGGTVALFPAQPTPPAMTMCSVCGIRPVAVGSESSPCERTRDEGLTEGRPAS